LEALVPIYEYRCSACAFQKEYLQKVSDPLLSVCPECGKETFGKMLTAAGFQLKGGGWYATDFKHSGAKPGAKTAGQGAGASQSEGKTGTAVGEGKTESKTVTPPAAAPVASASAAKAE
jgi:putative FmdB family regulatory protein